MLARRCIYGVLLGVLVGLGTSCGERRRETDALWGVLEPPEALHRISERAEDVILATADDNWPRVYRYIRDISDAWVDYQRPTVVPVITPRPPATLMHDQLGAALARLKDAAANRHAAEAMRAANDIDAAAVDLFEYYHPTIPPDLHRMRVLQRRIMLDAAEGRLEGLPTTLTRARSAWARARPAVAIRTSANVVTTFEGNLAAQQTALHEGNSEALATYYYNATSAPSDTGLCFPT
ncbi:MAG: hypothetical protein FJ280_26790 [Planctomycetes bacterium]|nr:hypothetical protein [Planctomycetota bacterium]